MDIKRAIITAAGKSQRTLPLQTLVDRDGETKTALAIIIEEVLAAGIEELCVVVCPGDEKAYRAAAGEPAKRLEFVEQKKRFDFLTQQRQDLRDSIREAGNVVRYATLPV